MIQWSWLTIAMCTLGFCLHVLGRWAEFWRTTGKVGLRDYLKLDPPGWAFSVLATLAAYLVLPEADVFGSAAGMTPLGALTAGYMGSSIGAKLPSLFGKGGVR